MKLYINIQALYTSNSAKESDLQCAQKYTAGNLPCTTLKLVIPNSWKIKKCRQLATFIIKTVNNHLKDSMLILENVRLTCQNIQLNLQSIVESTLHDYNTIVLQHVQQLSKQPLPQHNIMRCLNYGCGQLYTQDTNNDEACHYHEKNVVFHDCVKYWACCPDKKAYDWDDFQKLPTCKVGRHSCQRVKQVDNKTKCNVHQQSNQQHRLTTNLLQSTSNAKDNNEIRLSDGKDDDDDDIVNGGDVHKLKVNTAQVANVQIVQIPVQQQARITTGPRQFIVKNNHNVHDSSALPDGYARCANFGCGKVFCEMQNHNQACRFHKAGPVFWDTYKYWKCCPDKKCYEFDDFARVTGCCVGPHQRVRAERKENDKNN